MSDLVLDNSPPTQAVSAPRTVRAKNDDQSKTKVKIMIPKTRDATRDVYVGVNGTPYLLKRGVEIEVARPVAHALELARQTGYDEVIDQATGRATLVEQETMSVPFQYV